MQSILLRTTISLIFLADKIYTLALVYKRKGLFWTGKVNQTATDKYNMYFIDSNNQWQVDKSFQ